MTNIRKILERNSFTDTYYEPEDFIIFERDFDKLEKELQTLMTKAVNRAYKNALKKLKMGDYQ